jgi:predicted negative regulator of RcsB-dependent stress response
MKNQLLSFYNKNKKLVISFAILAAAVVIIYFFYCGETCRYYKMKSIERCHSAAERKNFNLDKDKNITEKFYNEFMENCIKIY